jgi:hypothetical protein
MLSKCSNPACPTTLLYLREGKIFAIQPNEADPASAKPVNRVEHFWLCGPCSEQMTLARDANGQICVLPKPVNSVRSARSARAAS